MAQNLKNVLIARHALIAQTINELEKKLKSFPEGRLSIKHRNNSIRYYHEGISSGCKYLKYDNQILINKLIQKNYLENVLKAAKQESAALEKSLVLYPSVIMEDVYDNLTPERKALAKPITLSDEEFANR